MTNIQAKYSEKNGVRQSPDWIKFKIIFENLKQRKMCQKYEWKNVHIPQLIKNQYLFYKKYARNEAMLFQHISQKAKIV